MTTRKKTFGDPIDLSNLKTRMVPQIPAARNAIAPLQPKRFARNGRYPDVALINATHEACNQGALFRTKQVFARGEIMTSIIASFGAGSRARWRFAFHTGPYTHALMIVVGMVPQSTAGAGQNAHARLDLTTNPDGLTGATATKFYHGANPGGSALSFAGWNALKPIIGYVIVQPDTDYYGTFYDVDYGRIACASVHELPSMTENFDGYLPQNLATQSHILDVYRTYQRDLLYNLWSCSPGSLINWSVNNGTTPVSITSATPTNVIDTTLTTISAASPGFTLDLSNMARRSKASTGIPVTMAAYGGTTGSDLGRVYLKNSSGTTMLQITNGWGTLLDGWQSVTGTLPATEDKYDIMFDDNSSVNAFELYAVSVYAHG